jgi:preprotein translocase subunit SecF
MILFAAEIIVTTVVIDDFKYSFFFWLDIIATASLISDIDWIKDFLNYICFSKNPARFSVDVIPGEVTVQSASQQKIAQVLKSLRLIRLIRIIKLYKYAIKTFAKDKEKEEDAKNKKKKKKKQPDVVVKMEEEAVESEFKKETDPSKLGNALSDSINRKTIIGVLLMLMVLPLFSPSEIDYSGEYALREAFWFGRSSCTDPDGFFCG